MVNEGKTAMICDRKRGRGLGFWLREDGKISIEREFFKPRD